MVSRGVPFPRLFFAFAGEEETQFTPNLVVPEGCECILLVASRPKRGLAYDVVDSSGNDARLFRGLGARGAREGVPAWGVGLFFYGSGYWNQGVPNWFCLPKLALEPLIKPCGLFGLPPPSPPSPPGTMS